MPEIRIKLLDIVNELAKSEAFRDFVRVVRCKNCKHLVRSEGVCKVLSNNYEPPVYVEDDDFCSHGERRTDDGEIH